jgi:hypothetical protein
MNCFLMLYSQIARLQDVLVIALQHAAMTACSLRRKTENQAGRALTEIIDVPEQFRGQPPRDLQNRIEYYHYWIRRTEFRDDYSLEKKARLLRALKRKLQQTEEATRNEHECACCGIKLRTPAAVGPECEKHRDKLPCNRFRRGRTRHDFSSALEA